MTVALASGSGPLAALALAAALIPSGAIARESRQEQIRAIRETIDGLLRDELTRLWYPRAVDRDGGGFHQEFARDWSPRPDDSRFLVYQARMTWTAAAFARYSEPHREEFTGYARHGLDYLDRVMRDEHGGGFHWSLGADGRIDPRQGDEKHVYGTSFVIYAASEVHALTGDDRALRVARDAFDWLEEHAHDPDHGGYFEGLTRDGKPLTVVDEMAPLATRTDRLGVYRGYKSMNSHIHLLEAVAALARVDDRPIVADRLGELLTIVRDRIAVEPGALNLYLTRDWRAVPAHDSFGHDVETAFLLVEAAESRGLHDDEPTWKVARQLVDHALDWGWDDEHGGFYDKGDAFGARPYDTTKVWWTQAEGLNALLLLHDRFGRETDRYWDAFLKQWQFIESHQLDPVHGGWFGEVSRAGELIGDGRKATAWKANYHTARAMMNVSARLGSLERDGPGGRPGGDR